MEDAADLGSAGIGTTVNIYGAVMTDTKREANSKVVRVVLAPSFSSETRPKMS